MRNKLLEIKKIIDQLLAEMPDENVENVENVESSVKIMSKDFEILKELLFSEKWPEAVFSAQIADDNSEQDKEERAEGICDIMLPPLDGKKFLDFGCGEGHAAKYMAKNSSFSVGYDIQKNPRSKFVWEENQDNSLLTTDFRKVEENGPYDAILIYDVLDHVQNESGADILSKAKSILNESGSIYVRCHPWTGRHGGHAYRKINKAFIHLVFDAEELNELGLGDLEPNSKFFSPLSAYYKMIEASGLLKKQEEIDSQEVEDFFRENPLVKQRILNSFQIQDWTSERPVFQMSQCFVDFVLHN